MAKADERVSHRGADVRTHDHGYGGVYVQSTGNQPDDDGGDRAGTLHQGGGEDAEDEAREWVGCKRKQLPGTLLTAACPLEASPDQSNGNNEKINEGQDESGYQYSLKKGIGVLKPG